MLNFLGVTGFALVIVFAIIGLITFLIIISLVIKSFRKRSDQEIEENGRKYKSLIYEYGLYPAPSWANWGLVITIMLSA